MIQNQFQPRGVRPANPQETAGWARLPITTIAGGGLLGSAPAVQLRPGLIGVRPNFQTLNPPTRPMQPGVSGPHQIQAGFQPGLLQTPGNQVGLIRAPTQMIPVQQKMIPVQQKMIPIHHQQQQHPRPQFIGQNMNLVIAFFISLLWFCVVSD